MQGFGPIGTIYGLMSARKTRDRRSSHSSDRITQILSDEHALQQWVGNLAKLRRRSSPQGAEVEALS